MRPILAIDPGTSGYPDSGSFMPNMTSAELLRYNARRYAKQLGGNPDAGDGPEDQLHADIIDECKRRRWQYFHSGMHKRTTINLGTPDFIVMADGGRTLYVECKTKDGKMTMEQLAVSVHAHALGHCVHVVRSFEEFLELL